MVEPSGQRYRTIEAAAEKGAHKSATSEKSIALVQEDVAYQLKAGYAKVISCKDLQKIAAQAVEYLPTSCRTATEPQGAHHSGSLVRYSRSTDQPEENKTGTDQKGTQACGHGCMAVSPQGYNDDWGREANKGIIYPVEMPQGVQARKTTRGGPTFAPRQDAPSKDKEPRLMAPKLGQHTCVSRGIAK
jgi:hypothetical protein